MEPDRRARREHRRWERRMERQLRALDRAAGSGPGLRRAARSRRTSGPVLPGLLISGILAAVVMLHDPGVTGYRFRQLVDHLRGGDQGSYAFLNTTPTGEPIVWDHCRPIPYVVNPAGAPDDWERIVSEGVAEAAEASGFRFEDDGTTTDRYADRHESDPAAPPPVLISFADAAEVPDLAGSTAGIGGSTPARINNQVRYVTGIVVLDSAAYDSMAARGDERSEELILAHELGHVLGLDHVDDNGELMNAQYVGQGGFGPGDREGLQRLRELPCG